MEHDFNRIGPKSLLLNARRIYTPDEKFETIILAIEDVTKERRFNEELKKHIRILEEKVAEHTRDLEFKVKQLEKMNAIMIDREVAMALLKDKIVSLEKLTEEIRKS